MARRMKTHLDFITMLNKATQKQARVLLQHMSQTQMKAITEIFFNILHGNIPMTDEAKKCLGKKKRIIRRVTAIHTTSLSKRRTHLVNNACIVKCAVKLALNYYHGK